MNPRTREARRSLPELPISWPQAKRYATDCRVKLTRTGKDAIMIWIRSRFCEAQMMADSRSWSQFDMAV